MISLRPLIILVTILVSGPSIEAQKDGYMTVTLFFHNEHRNPNMEDCRKVFPTMRRVPLTKAPANAALTELFKGVTEDEKKKEFWSPEAEKTRGILKSINVKGSIAYVNFTKAMYEQMGIATTSCGGSAFFSSVEKTLLQFSTIRKVVYAIEGSPRDFYEWVQVGECPPELRNCSGKNFR